MAKDKDTIAFASLRHGVADFLSNTRNMSTGSLSAHRGFVDEEGRTRRGCSIEFLHFLSLEILRARSFAYVEISRPDIDVDQHAKRCEYVEHEVARLIQFPSLFPSPMTRGRFLALLAIDSELCFSTACKELLIASELRKWDAAWQSVCRPRYDPGSKGWENFLRHGAPGTGYAVPPTNPPSYLQIIPGVATRIVADVESEERELMRMVETLSAQHGVSPDQVLMAPRNLATLADADDKKIVKMNRAAYMDSSRRSPFRDWLEPRSDYVRPGPAKLTDFPTLIRRVERQPGQPIPFQPLLTGANYWLAIYLRSWHACRGTKAPESLKEEAKDDTTTSAGPL